MAPDVLRVLLEVASLLVLAATALAALVQLRQVRKSNQLRALVSMQNSFLEPQMQDALRFVQFELPERLNDRAYRIELATRGYVDPERHPELRACNWFEGLGAMFKHDLVDENGFMEIFARLVAWYWDRLNPVVALMRRSRSAAEYHNFEYLAVRAAQWRERYPQGIFPPRYRRLAVIDPWKEIDAAEPIELPR